MQVNAHHSLDSPSLTISMSVHTYSNIQVSEQEQLQAMCTYFLLLL